MVFVVAFHYQMPSCYIFAITSMSFRDLPLLYDMIGCLLKLFSAEADFLLDSSLPSMSF